MNGWTPPTRSGSSRWRLLAIAVLLAAAALVTWLVLAAEPSMPC